MRLSRANIPLASEDRTHSQAISPSPHYNLAPHFWPGFINLQHFRHSRWRNPVRLSKSGEKRSCRKYAYSKKLEDVGEDLAELAWDRAKGKTDDERSFIHTAAYHYSDSFIERPFRELSAASGAEGYQLRKLFSRKGYIETQEWLWLESNLPITFVYLAALRGHTLSDEQCISLYRTARMAEVAKDSWRLPEDVLAHGGYNGLLLWCFARMNKWSVVRS